MKFLGICLMGLSAFVGLSWLFGHNVSAIYGSVAIVLLLGSMVVYEAAQPTLRRVFALVLVAFLSVSAIVLWPLYAMAQDAGATTISAGSLFSDVRGPIETALGVVIAAVLGWLSYMVKSNLGLSIDGKMRDTLQSALMNGVHFGLDQVQHAADQQSIDVKSTVVLQGIQYVREYAPKAIKHFGLSEDDLAKMLKAKLAELQPAETKAVAKAAGA